MRTPLIAVCLLILCTSATAQQLDEPNRLLLLSKYEEAKKEIDKTFTDPKAKESADALLLRTKIYGEVFFDSTLRSRYPDAGQQAVSALRQYVAKEPSLLLFKQFNGMRPASILYSVSLQQGVKLFSASKWEQALEQLIIAEDLGDFISKNNLGRNRQNIDTLSVLYAGYAAQNANNADRAEFYYRKFAAEKIGGQDYIEIYRYLLGGSLKKKKAVDFENYLTLVKQLYPGEQPLWNAYQYEYIMTHSGLKYSLAFYKAKDQAGIFNASDYVSFAEYFANAADTALATLKEEDRPQVKTLGAQAFAKAFAKQDNPVYAFNAGILYYQQYATVSDQVNAGPAKSGTQAPTKTKRDQLLAKQQQLADLSIEWLEKTYQLLQSKTGRSSSETSCLSKSVDFLAELYAWKRDMVSDKAAKAYADFNTRFKQYDIEHGKYK